jgi:hypothetical protein
MPALRAAWAEWTCKNLPKEVSVMKAGIDRMSVIG